MGKPNYTRQPTAAAVGKGMRSMMRDMGVDMNIRLLTDSSTAKASIARKGLGNVRHIDTNELWLQERMRNGDMHHVKIKNVLNVADLLAKHQPKETIDNLMELLDHKIEEGRSMVAPTLNAFDDNNLLVPQALYAIGIPFQPG